MISTYKPDFSRTPFVRKSIKPYQKADEGKSKPSVSIVTAFYNTGNIFWQTFYSIINQTYTDFEWLIVNDGSTKEEAVKILAEVESFDDRVKVINNPQNIGLGNTRNNGVRHSKAEYIFFIDSDDIVEFTFLEKCMICLELNPQFSFVGSYTVAFDAKEYLWQHGFIKPSLFLDTNYAVNCFVCRKEVFSEVQYMSDKGGMEDWDFWLHCASKGFWGRTIPEYLYWYRERNNRAADWENFRDAEKAKKLKEGFDKKYREKIESRSFDFGFSKKKVAGLLPTSSGKVRKSKNVLLMLDYDIYCGYQEIIQDYVNIIRSESDNITIVINKLLNCSYNGDFLDATDDIFIFNHLADETNHSQILAYLVRCRGIGAVIHINIHGGLSYSAFLKALFPDIRIDLIIINLDGQKDTPDLLQKDNFGKLQIDNVLTATNDIRLSISANEDIFGKAQFFPPSLSKSIPVPSKSFVEYQKRALGISADTKLISVVANMTFRPENYVMQYVVEKLLNEGQSDFIICFFVWGEAVADFRNYVFDRNIQNRIWVFHTDPTDSLLTDRIGASDVYLDIGTIRGLSDGLRKAIVAGVPVVSVGNMFIKDILDQYTGLLLEGNQDPSRISDFIGHSLKQLLESVTLQDRFRRRTRTKAMLFNSQHRYRDKIKNLRINTSLEDNNTSVSDSIVDNIISAETK